MPLTDILVGSTPAQALRNFIAENPDATKMQLALEFSRAFPGVSGEAHQIIWHWKSPLRTIGMDDATLNEELLRVLSEAGYSLK